MNEKLLVGWRETLSLPELGIEKIRAKIDTGARTSCLHTFKVERFHKDAELWVRFWIHPLQRDTSQEVVCESKVIDQRVVRDSGGHEEIRYVIESTIRLGQQRWKAELTLTNRENMAFRMLLGRTAMHHRMLVDPVKSFLVPFEESQQ